MPPVPEAGRRRHRAGPDRVRFPRVDPGHFKKSATPALLRCAQRSNARIRRGQNFGCASSWLADRLAAGRLVRATKKVSPPQKRRRMVRKIGRRPVRAVKRISPNGRLAVAAAARMHFAYLAYLAGSLPRRRLDLARLHLKKRAFEFVDLRRIGSVYE